MSVDQVREKLTNVFVVLLVLAVTVAAGFQEDHIRILENGSLWFKPGVDGAIFWVLLAAGFLLVFWLALTITTLRLVSFVVAVVIIEYFNQTIGTRLDLWHYSSPQQTYLFGICVWVTASLFAYLGASKAVCRLSMRSWLKWPRWFNPVVIIALLAIIWYLGPAKVKELDFQDAWYSDSHLFWLFFVALAVVGALASLWADSRLIIGIVISAVIVGFISESSGAAATIWKFPGSEQTFCPPVYLILGCWPLEILAQFALSALFAGEALVVLPPSDGEGNESGAPGDPCKKTESEKDSPNELTDEDKSDSRSDEPKSDPGSASQEGNPDPSGSGPTDHPITAHEAAPRRLEITNEERDFKVFLQFSAIAYLVVGFVFFLAPDWVMQLLQSVGTLGTAPHSAPTLPAGTFEDIHLVVEVKSRFWVTMTFSMMMCIAFLAFYAQYNIRKNKVYVVPLLVAKAASAGSGLLYFIFVRSHFPFLAVFIVDGIIFWVTLCLFLRASRGFLKAQTAYFRKELHDVKTSGKTVVASLKGEDKKKLLDDVLEESGFLGVLEKRCHDARKERKDLRIAIKPNFMFAHAKEDCSTYTDPELVEHLVDILWKEGFRKIKVVESQSTLGNHYAQRDVNHVAQVLGYTNPKGRYEIADLTLEKIPHDYKGRLGKHYVGESWKDADFRISFAKNKTHVFCSYTLTLKNIYGTLPLQNKLKYYHTEREYDWPTIESMKEGTGFPVHFGLIDAFISADGQFGVMVDPQPNLTKTIIGGANLAAVDWVGCTKMGMDPDDFRIGRFYYLAVKEFGRPDIEWFGDKSVYKPWENVSQIFIQALDIIEEAYHFSDWGFSCLSACSAAFPFKVRNASVLFLRWLLRPAKGIYYKHDVL